MSREKLEMSSNLNSRRDFLIGSAVLSGVAVVASASAGAATKGPESWDQEVDVLVVGAGLAGICAAIEACQAGAEVLVVEKAPMAGGHSGMSGAGFFVGGTEIQKTAGISDSKEKNYQDAIDSGIKAHGFIKRDTAVVKRVFEEGPGTVTWLQGLGVQFLDKPVISAGTIPRVHYVAPGYKRGAPVLIKTVREQAEKLGAKFMLQTAFVSLVTQSGTPVLGDRVVGAVLKSSRGKIFRVKARRGLVLACGGFANGPEMVKRLHPYLAGVRSLGSPFNSGDGITAAAEIGANIVLEYYGFGMNMLCVGTRKGQSFGLPMTEAPLIVSNKAGQRFVDETRGYLAACREMVSKKYPTGNWIFDEQTKLEFEGGCLKPLFETEIVNRYDSIEALAVGEKIDPAALNVTLAKYNADVVAGKDSKFGRTRLLRKIDKAPFYAFEFEPKIYTSYSGLEIDPEARVITESGKPIPGLYAAGDVCGHLVYQANLGAGGLGIVSGLVCATSYGRIAGRNAAQQPA